MKTSKKKKYDVWCNEFFIASCDTYKRALQYARIAFGSEHATYSYLLKFGVIINNNTGKVTQINK